MPQVLVWKSQTDGRLFEDKSAYQKHLRKLAAARRSTRLLERHNQEREQFLAAMGQVGSIEDLEKFVKDNWSWFWTNGSQKRIWHEKNPGFHEYVEVSFNRMRWSETVSNTHSCPRGGVTNWGLKSGLPTGYPGWSGNIQIRVRPPTRTYQKKPYMLDGWGASYFEDTPIKTGTGGGGSGKDCKEYSYDVKLFAADFPVMYEQIRREHWIAVENSRRERAWRELGGSGVIPPVTDVPKDWTCPDPLVQWYTHPVDLKLLV